MRVLITPLNWGLGHASRCIPIIDYLLANGHEPIIGSSGEALLFLKKVYPALSFLELPDYKIRYPFRSAILNFLSFSPKMCLAIWKEQRIIQAYLKENQVDYLISDNRLGCYASHIPTAYISHQLRFAFKNQCLSYLAALAHYLWYRRFDEVWVPDLPPPNSISGYLSKHFAKTKPKYLGILSQMTVVDNPIQYRALVLLSGPEPQRSLLEKKITEELSGLSGIFLLIRGLPTDCDPLAGHQNITIQSFLSGAALSEAIASAKYVICRSGYSSIMDLVTLQKPAILIPTPGQPEQAY